MLCKAWNPSTFFVFDLFVCPRPIYFSIQTFKRFASFFIYEALRIYQPSRCLLASLYPNLNPKPPTPQQQYPALSILGLYGIHLQLICSCRCTRLLQI